MGQLSSRLGQRYGAHGVMFAMHAPQGASGPGDECADQQGEGGKEGAMGRRLPRPFGSFPQLDLGVCNLLRHFIHAFGRIGRNAIGGICHELYDSSHGSGYAPYGSGYPYNDLSTGTADGAAITIQPDANSAVITVVNAGAQVKVLDSTNGPWTHVEANGQDGFMRTGALR